MENIGFKTEIWNRLIMSKGDVSCEVKPKNSLNRRWIAIYKIDKEEYQFRYFDFEISKKNLENDWDWSEEEEISTEIFVKDEKELLIILEKEKININNFDYPWNNDYPY